MRFSNPIALLLLLLLIPILWIGWPGRGYDRRREISALVLRTALVILTVMAITGLELLQRSDKLAVVFLLDGSDSVSAEMKEAGRDFISRSLAEMGPEDRAAVVLFGGDALVESPMSGDRELGTFLSVPETSQTDLGEAVRLAMALFPSDAARRIVLITDGRQTSGDLSAAARLAADSGIDFMAVPLTPGDLPGEITLLRADFPAQLIEGESFEATITVHATRPGPATIRIFGAGRLLYEGQAVLDAGTQTFRIPLIAEATGFTNYQVLLSAVGDFHFQNNQLSAYSEVVGPPKILLVAPPAGESLPVAGAIRPDESSHLASALEAAGFIVESARPSALPFELALLSEYASIILVNVPARDLAQRQMDALQSYVRDLGGGLVTVGGPTSYGVGGYYRTTLEEILPLDMEIKDQERRPSLTMVFVIDRSGSMNDSTSGFSKLELAREAAARSVELLFPGDKVGVIAFDDSASWVVPIRGLDDPDFVVRQIESIGIGGGTDILAGLQAMAEVLPQDDSLVKHVILLTDGGASSLGIPTLVENLYQQYEITLTTVGVGPDAAPFLEEIAILGGGRYHFTDRPESIPSIFTEETSLATRSYIIEETFFPQLASRSQILSGLAETPPLHGYIGTSSKSTAQTILVSEQGDPVLAAWQYGLGRTASWTSDATARWSRDWVAWDGFPRFWAQVVRYTVREQIQSPLSVQVRGEGDSAAVIVDARSESGEFLNGLSLSAIVIGPDGQARTIELPQSAPGLYEGAFRGDVEGTYLLRIDGESGTGEAVTQISGWVLPYSPEYRPPTTGGGMDLLQLVADQTGGSLVPIDNALPPFSHNISSPDSRQPVWHWLVAIALLLLPFDIAVRRLAFSRRDIRRWWEKTVSALQPQVPQTAAASTRSNRVSSLLQAKDRAQKRPEDNGEAQKPTVAGKQTARQESTGRAAVFVRQEAAPKKDRTEDAKPKDSPDAPEPSSASTTATLLARKRARQRNQRQDD